MNRLIAMQAETVIVADDHPLFRTAIKEAIEVCKQQLQQTVISMSQQ